MPPKIAQTPLAIATLVPKTQITGNPQTYLVTIPAHNYPILLLMGWFRNGVVANPASVLNIIPRLSTVNQVGNVSFFNASAVGNQTLALSLWQCSGASDTAGKTGMTEIWFYDQNNNNPNKHLHGLSNNYGGTVFNLYNGVIDDTAPMNEILLDMNGTDTFSNLSYVQVLGIPGVTN